MITKGRWRVQSSGLGLSLPGLGVLGGLMVTQLRVDQQGPASLNFYDTMVEQVSVDPLALDPNAAGEHQASVGPWTAHLRRVDDALGQRNLSAADLAWRDAYVAALVSRRWDGLVEVGDAYLRIGEVARGRKTAEAKARSIYLDALFRARHQGSLDGALRVAEAFTVLGDHELALQGARIAEALAAKARDPQARDRARAARERMVTLRAVKSQGGGPF